MERAPNHLYTETDEGLREVEAEAVAALAAGLPVELTEQSDLPFRDPGRGAARRSAAARLGCSHRRHRRAAEAAGARIHEHSRVRSIAHGSPCRLDLENGSALLAERVVLATQMPLLDRGLFFARLRPQASYGVAAPAADAPLGMYLGIGGSLRSIRSTPPPAPAASGS